MVREELHSRRPSLMINEAKDQKDALAMIRTSLPDLVLMDIRLPDGSGLELTRQIKELYPNLNVVILTSYDQDEYREAAFRYKADHYVSKDNFMALLIRILPETFEERF
jgi:DNA-binding NarL/FixJ family response regulator